MKNLATNNLVSKDTGRFARPEAWGATLWDMMVGVGEYRAEQGDSSLLETMERIVEQAGLQAREEEK
jgi:hypothetical protein